jgi:hypothetical protein
MKKLLTLATAALLITGVTFANDGGKKKGKSCCKKGQHTCCMQKDKAAR